MGLAAMLALLVMTRTLYYPCRLLPSQQQALRTMLIQTSIQFNNSGIVYMIDEGTLLGIVRGGDVIAWDTDIDIVVPQKYSNKVDLLFPDQKKTRKFYHERSLSQHVMWRPLYKRLYVEVSMISPLSKVHNFENRTILRALDNQFYGPSNPHARLIEILRRRPE